MVDLSGYGTKAKKGTAVITKRDGSKIYVKDSKVVAERTKSGKSRVRIQVADVGKGSKKRKAGLVASDVKGLKSIATQNKVVKVMGAQQRFQAKVNQALRDVQAGRQQLTPTLRRLLLDQESSRVSPLVRTTPKFAKDVRKSEEIFEQQRVQKELGRLVESKVLRPEIRKQIGLNADERAIIRQIAQLQAKNDPSTKFLLEARKKKEKFTDATQQTKAVADFLKDKLLIKSLAGKNVPAVINEIGAELVIGIPEAFVNLGALGVYGADMGKLYLKNIYGKDKRAREVATQTFNNNLRYLTSKDFGKAFFQGFNPKTPEGVANIIFLLTATGGLKNLGKAVGRGAVISGKTLKGFSRTLKTPAVARVVKDFKTRSLFTRLVIDPKAKRLLFTGRTKVVKVPTKTGAVVVKGFNQRSLALTPKVFTNVNNSISRVLAKFPTVRKYYTPNLRKAVLLIEDKNGFLKRTVSLPSAKGFRLRAGKLLSNELRKLNVSLLRLSRKVSLKTLRNKINTFFTGFKTKLNTLFDKLKLEGLKIKGTVVRGKKVVLNELNKLGVNVKNIKTDFVNKFPKTFTVYDKEAGKLAKFIVRKDGQFVRILNVRTLGGLRRQYSRLLVSELNKLNKGLSRLSSNTKLFLVKNRITSFFNSLKNKLDILFKKFDVAKAKVTGKVKRVSKSYDVALKDLGLNVKDVATLKRLRTAFKQRTVTVYDKNIGDLRVLLLNKEGKVLRGFKVATAKKFNLASRRLVKQNILRITKGVSRIKDGNKAVKYLSSQFKALKNKVAKRYDTVLSKVKERKVAKVLKKDVLEISFKDGVTRKPTSLTKSSRSFPKEVKKTTSTITVTPKKTVLIRPDGQQLVVVSKTVKIPLTSTVKKVVVVKTKQAYDSYARLMSGLIALTPNEFNKLNSVKFNGTRFSNPNIKSLLKGNVPRGIIDVKSTQSFDKKISQAKVSAKKKKVSVTKKEKLTQKVAQKEKVNQRQKQAQKRKQAQFERLVNRLRTVLRRAKRRLPKRISSILKKPKLSMRDKEELVAWFKSFKKKYRPSLSSVIFGFTGFKIPKSVMISPVTTRRIIVKR